MKNHCTPWVKSFLRSVSAAAVATLLAVSVACQTREPQPQSQPVSSLNGQAVTVTGSTAGLGALLTQMAPCPKEANMAAFQKLNPVLGHIDDTSGESIASAEKSIACYRPWAETLTDSCQREAIAEWLDYYEGRVQRAKEELRRGNRESDSDKQMREYDEQVAKARAWERQHPFPKLPQCDVK